MNSTHVITMIPLSKLHPHPANANTMSPALLRKLQTHIAASGRYEPLLVRPHPQIAGEFQLINGHHRKRILERLGHAEAACLIWNLDDAQTPPPPRHHQPPLRPRFSGEAPHPPARITVADAR